MRDMEKRPGVAKLTKAPGGGGSEGVAVGIRGVSPAGLHGGSRAVP